MNRLGPARLRWLFAAAAVVVCGGGCATSNPPGSAATAPLEEVIDALGAALSEALAAQTPDFPPLKVITVKLQTTTVRSLSGEVSVVVFSAGSSVEREDVSTIELRLRPPPPPPKGVAATALKDALARAIHLAQAASARAARGTPPLSVDRAEIEVKFSVEVGGSAGGRVALVPLGIEAAGKIRRASVQTINLVFGG